MSKFLNKNEESVFLNLLYCLHITERLTHKDCSNNTDGANFKYNEDSI